MIQLRDYQGQVVREVSALFVTGITRVLIQMATGAGKTRTAGYIVARFVGAIATKTADPGRPVLWSVPAEELLLQASMVFAEMGIKHQVIAQPKTVNAIRTQHFREFGAVFIDPGALLSVGMIQTIDRRLEKLEALDPDLIITDEAHMSLNATHRRVIDGLMLRRDARLRSELGEGVEIPVKSRTKLIGLTATPWRMDGQPFALKDGGLYEAMVTGPSMAELIEMGHLSRYDAYQPELDLVGGINPDDNKGDYNPSKLDAELSSPKIFGDVIKHYETYSAGKPAIGFCPTTAKAEEFAEAFRRAGYRAVSLDSSTDDFARREALLQLARGELDVIMSCQILVAGVDVPYATTALLLTKTKSLTKYLQSVGRVLRVHPLKGYAIILDFVGVIAMHGLPDDDYEWSLDAPPKRRRADASNDEDFGDEAVPALSVCPDCRKYHTPSKVCPHCGYAYPIKARRDAEQVDVDLVKIDREMAEQMRRHRRVMQAQAKTVDELVAQGMRRLRAMKIVEARKQKDKLRSSIMAKVDDIRKVTRCTFSEATDGVYFGDFMDLKPKGLEDLLRTVTYKSAQLAKQAA